MTRHKILFRLLLLASFLCSISTVMLERYPVAQGAGWESSIAHRGAGALPWREWLAEFFQFQFTAEMLLVTLGALYALSLVGYIGLFVFSRMGRFVFLLVLMIHIALTLASGLSVLSPLEQVLADLGLVFDGALLALAYASPISALFQHVESRVPVSASQGVVEEPVPEMAASMLPKLNRVLARDAVPPLPQI
jgi:hypothetical protein